MNNAPCKFPGQDEHPLGDMYWQVPGIGDICNPCHDQWMIERNLQQRTADFEAVSETTHTRASRFESSGQRCASCGTLQPTCRNPSCSNRPRYDSGLCGVCDVVYNDGKGTLRRR